ncbi:protein kinase domain-containing protein [Streptomyces sp. JL4002]|uniref:protein kinase domain-containing protein n=1 Tax=Streptomyces sp. JL4002 TaxID=3404781 RepID=UPI003B27D3CB
MAVFEALKPEDPPLVGRYRLVARLGAGGMGLVYLARSPGGRPVAVKVVRPELAEDGDFRRRFAREVTAARRVNGAFTAGVIDADADGSPAWLATLYVPGVSLSEAITGHGPWPAPPIFALGAGVAEALEAIHAVGVVHRDLKPSNILLAADGPRVIDFGISVASGAGTLTHTGTTIGTPGFMSPEQLTDQPVGPASDVFALGAVLAYTGTGTGPFGTGTAHALHYRAVHEAPNLASLAPDLREVVAACLDKDPDRRPTVANLLARLACANRTGEGADTATVALSAEPWMPDRVAWLIQSHTANDLPGSPPAERHSPAPPVGPSPAPGPHRSTSGTAGHHHPGPPVLRQPAPAGPTPVAEPLDVIPPGSGRSPEPGRPMVRRRTVLGLAGTALTVGAGLTGWKLTNGTSDSGARTSGSPSKSSSPNRTGSSDAGSTGGGNSSSPGGGKDAGTGLARITDIPEGGGKIFKREGVVITQPEAGAFMAFSATCTHAGCPVTEIANGVIRCPCHGSDFSIIDGSVQNGPATNPLPPQRISVDGEAITLA